MTQREMAEYIVKTKFCACIACNGTPEKSIPPCPLLGRQCGYGTKADLAKTWLEENKC